MALGGLSIRAIEHLVTKQYPPFRCDECLFPQIKDNAVFCGLLRHIVDPDRPSCKWSDWSERAKLELTQAKRDQAGY